MFSLSDNDKMATRTDGDIDADETHTYSNITGPFDYYYWIRLNRKVADEDIRNIEQDKMPGFRLSWKYEKEVKFWARYKFPNKFTNNQFIRLSFFNCDIYKSYVKISLDLLTCFNRIMVI